MAKITYEDLFELVGEIERGAKDKTRTLNSVSNSNVKKMLESEATMAFKAGVTASVFGGGAATGAIIGIVGGAGTGAVATGVTTLGGGAVSL